MTRYYSGIGPRRASYNIISRVTSLGVKMEKLNFTLRSGGAIGLDTAFAKMVKNKEIYRPKHATPESIKIASQFHPAWHNCNEYVKRLHGRNVKIILGDDLKTPSELVITWLPGGKLKGGTALGIRVAKHYEIPVFNLAIDDDSKKLKEILIKYRKEL